MKNEVLIPFAPVLMESTRSIGYTFESAIADIIDNSISGKAKNIKIIFDTLSDPILSIIDDGIGMNESELIQAMRYGSKSSLDKRSIDDLGRFGLGLKTASLSQCRSLTVISKFENTISAVCWDLDYIIQCGDWVLKIYPPEEIINLPNVQFLNKLKSGTIVTWQVFDRLETSSKDVNQLFNEKIQLAREHLSLVFHRFIEPEDNSPKLNIEFNNEKVLAKDPFLTKNSATQILASESIIYQDQKIHVKPYILPYYNKLTNNDKIKLGNSEDLRQQQGFYVYRNKRLIIWGTWFRLIKQNELSKLARVRVDIPNELDSIWEIDVKKSTANVPDLLKHNLVRVVTSAIDRSENVFRHRGRKETSDTITHVWDLINNRGSYHYRINQEMEIFKMVEAMIPENQLSIFSSFIEIIENAFPYQDVYYRLAKDQNAITLNDDTELFDKAVEMLERLKVELGNYQEAIRIIERIDYFAKSKDVINRLKKEHKDE
jgi:hypothetical protein